MKHFFIFLFFFVLFGAFFWWLDLEDRFMLEENNVPIINHNDNLNKQEEDKNDDSFSLVNSKVVLAFDEPMDRISVEKNLKIYPQVEIEIEWIDDQNLEIIFPEEKSQAIEYLINLQAKKKDGQLLATPITKKFKTIGIAKIDFVTPEGKVENENKYLTVRFNQPMVALTTLDNQASCPVSLTPQVDGKCVWITSSTFQFRPVGWWPKGADYTINIPANLETINGQKTINSKEFHLKTPPFNLLANDNLQIKKEKPLLLVFNDEVNLKEVANNFELVKIENQVEKILLVNDYQLDFYQTEDGQIFKNIVQVFLKTKDWGYGQKYFYTVKGKLTSLRGNIPLAEKDQKKKFSITNFLEEYNSFIYQNETIEEKRNILNLKKATEKNIIPAINPQVIFELAEEIDLDKELFSLSPALPFELFYVKETNCQSGQCVVQENRKKVILEIKGEVANKLQLNIKLSAIAQTNDLLLYFKVGKVNQILDFKFIDYNNSCLEFQNKMEAVDLDKFDFGEFGQALSLSKVYVYSRYDDSQCFYEKGKNKYLLRTKLKPSQDFVLNIDSTLLDQNNIALDQDYSFSFQTNKAENEDKLFSLIDWRNFILVPNTISPLGVGIKTFNLKNLEVEVCEGDLLKNNHIYYLENANCRQRTIVLNDLGFTANFSVLDLNAIFGKEFTKPFIQLKINKQVEDQSKWEKKYGKKETIIYSFTDKNLVLLQTAKKDILWITDFVNGDNLTNQVASISSIKKEYSNSKNTENSKNSLSEKKIVFSAKEDGLYELEGDLKNSLKVVFKSGETVFLDIRNYYYNSKNNNYLYLKTDRPLYKAGNTVHIKGVARQLTINGFIPSTVKQIKVEVVDPQYKTILEKEIGIDENGSFELEFTIDPEAPLGQYHFQTEFNQLSFLVQEYEKPDFKIEVEVGKEFYQWQETAQVKVQADYFAGFPLINALGKYSISTTNYNFSGGKTSGYLWGENQNWFEWGRNNYSSYGETVIANQEFTVDNQGQADLDILLTNQAKSEAENKDKSYQLSVEITDPFTKKTVSMQTVWQVLKSKIMVGLKLNKFYYSFGDDLQIDFITVDEEGNPIAKQDIIFKVYSLKYEQNQKTLNYEETEELLIEKELQTDNQGKVDFNYQIKNYGRLKLVIVLKNGQYKTTKNIFVSGAELLSVEEENHQLNILTEKEEYKLGETAKIVIQSPYKGVKALILVEKLDEVLHAEVVDIDSFSFVYNLPIVDYFIPNVQIRVFLVKDQAQNVASLKKLTTLRQEMTVLEQQLLKKTDYSNIWPLRNWVLYDLTDNFIWWSSTREKNLDKELLQKLADLRKKENQFLQDLLPNYLLGTKNIKVDLTSVQLDVQVKLDKEMYGPAQPVKIELNITDAQGNGVNGQATIAIVDQALLSLVSDKTAPLLDYFYSEKNVSNHFTFNLVNLIKRLEFQFEESDGEMMLNNARGEVVEKSFSWWGKIRQMKALNVPMANMVGGASPDNSTKVRADFKDLAFYQGTVEVVNGQAQILVDALPDDLTTWVVKGFVITADTKVGEFQTEFQTKKALNLLPSIPRFFMTADQTAITAVVINNSGQDLELKATLEMSNVNNLEKEQIITLKNKEQKSVQWPIEIAGLSEQTDGNNFKSEILLKVESMDGKFIDQVKLERQILPYSTPEYVFTNGSTNELSYEEKIVLPETIVKNMGKIDVSIGATFLTNLTDSLTIENLSSWNFYSILNFVQKAKILEDIYWLIGQPEKFTAIKVRKEKTLIEKDLKTAVLEVIKNIKEWQQKDGGFGYLKECHQYYSRSQTSCSNFSLTGDFLQVAFGLKNSEYAIDNQIVNKALEYYKKELITQIEKLEKNSIVYSNIEPFYILKDYDESIIIKYLLTKKESLNKENFSNLEKVKLAIILSKFSPNNQWTINLIQSLKNTTFVEARGTMLPSNNNHHYFGDNDNLTTALFTRLLITQGESEKLLVENMLRWLLVNKEQNYYFRDIAIENQILKTVIEYLKANTELKKVDLIGEVFLNSQAIIKNIKINNDNKFSLLQTSFNLDEYLQFGEKNSNNFGISKKGTGRIYYDLGLQYFLPIEEILARDEGIIVNREYYNYQDYLKNEEKVVCPPYFRLMNSFKGLNLNRCFSESKRSNLKVISEWKQGEFVVGKIEIVLPVDRNNVIVNNFIPAGAEIVNTNFETTSSTIKEVTGNNKQEYYWRNNFDLIEVRDEQLLLYADHLEAGSYSYTYVLQLQHKGRYHHRPAISYELKRPEIWGRSGGGFFEIR